MEPPRAPRNRQRPTEQEAAYAIAFVLSGEAGVVSVPVEVTAILLAAAPLFPTPDLREKAASEIARALVAEIPPHPDRAPGPARRAIYRENLIRRAQYGINALKRVARSTVVEDPERNVGERLTRAIEREGKWYGQHLEASGQRVRGAMLIDAAYERWGKILGWRSNVRPTSRPHHARAHLANFDATKPPRETQGYPATLTFCECTVGPPSRGARMLD